MIHRQSILLATLMIASTVATLAFAQAPQPWLEDRRDIARIGVRAGDLELHPGVAGEVGYDSNYFQAAGTEPAGVFERVVPSARFRLTPSLTINTLSGLRRTQDGRPGPPPSIDFSGRLAGTLNQLLALDEDYGGGDRARTYLDGEASATLNVLPRRPWGAAFTAGAARITQPLNDPGLTLNTFNRNVVNGGAELRWRPGGGVLQWSLGYDGRLTLYDREEFGLDLLEHDFRMRGRWMFFPKTAALFEGSVGIRNYTDARTRQLDSNPMSSQLGLNGLITSKFALLVMGGWKATFFEPGPLGQREDYDGPIGRAELTWFISGRSRLRGAPQERSVGLSTLRLGYQRDANDSGIANFYTLDRAYGALTYTAAGVLMISLNGGVSFVQHPVPRNRAGEALTLDGEGLSEIRPDARLFIEYRMVDTFAIFGNAGFSSSLGDNLIMLSSVDGPDPTRFDNLHYTRFTTLLGARWFM